MISFKHFIHEKTLTPAEKKKREEVAQAIEKENPGMPMPKKMAIATKTAKRVAEEVGKDLDGLRRHPEWNLDDYEKWKNRGYTHADIRDMWGQRQQAKATARKELQQEIKDKEKEKKKK